MWKYPSMIPSKIGGTVATDNYMYAAAAGLNKMREIKSIDAMCS